MDFPDVTRLGLEGDIQCSTRQREGPPQPAEVEGWRVLAAAIGTALHVEPVPSRTRAPRSTSPVPRAGRVLSVDDDSHQSAFLRAVLTLAGYDVRTCGDPARFYDDQGAFAPDLVLMHVLLPGTTGTTSRTRSASRPLGLRSCS